MFYDLPEGVQFLIWKKVFTLEIVPRLEHKDWWFHTVKCRSESHIGYLDAEIHGGSKFFCKNF